MIDDFVDLMVGNFDNIDQFKQIEKEGKIFPYARHTNTVCDDKIDNLPIDFKSKFVLEESYYDTNGKQSSSSHLFLISEHKDGILLSSYEISNLTYQTMPRLNFNDLKESKKFTPALYKLEDGVYKGGSVSKFSPVMTFKLYEEFSKDSLIVSESMEVNGKRVFGYDDPIVYIRIEE